MIATFLNSFSLRTTYRVNSIIYALKQIPLIKRLLPKELYASKDLKLFGNVIAGIWEFCHAFLGKFLYFLVMIFLATTLYGKGLDSQIYMHIFFFLSLAGSFTNTYLLNANKITYYAIYLMRMDAKKYALSDYLYNMLKLMIGFLVFGLIFGGLCSVPIYQSLILPFFVAGLKITAAGIALRSYKKTGKVSNENTLNIPLWVSVAILLFAAYGLPAIGYVIPSYLVTIGMILPILTGLLSIKEACSFDHYREYYQVLTNTALGMQVKVKEKVRNESLKSITTDTTITSSLSGLSYLNDLFIKRHHKILWKSSIILSTITILVTVVGNILFYFNPGMGNDIHDGLLLALPYFTLIMYFFNRGTKFTTALFTNCDHSLLTYSFFKSSKTILQLFRIRLIEIIKVNLVPALCIAIGLTLTIYLNGGTSIANYVGIFITIPAVSCFFSIHYLTIYYLLQPFNKDTQVKSPLYQIISGITYFICFFISEFKIPAFPFSIGVIIFTIVYTIVACVLVYFLAPKTFRIRT